MILAVLLACARPPVPLEAPDSAAERDAPVVAAPAVEVLLAGLGDPAGDVQALAVEALLVDPLPCGAAGQMCGYAPALALVHRDDDRVRLGVVRGLAAHPDDAEAGTLLAAIARGDTGANIRVRGYAALALAKRPDAAAKDVVRSLVVGAPKNGAALGLWAAGFAVGAPGAADAVAHAFRESTLPIEGAWFAALPDPSLPWGEALRRAEPIGRPALVCGMLVAGAPGAASAAAGLLHGADEDLRGDMAAALAVCPTPAADRALAGSARVEARLARVERGTLSPDFAVALLPTDRWADAVHALAARPDAPAHDALASFAAGASDVQREALAVALARAPLPSDLALLGSLATDASVRTRVAAARALHHLQK